MRACFLLSIFLLHGLSLFSQTAQTGAGVSKRKKKEVYETVDHVMKLNIPSLLFRTLALQYEYKLRPGKTLALGLIYRPSFTAPFSQAIEASNNGGLSPETVYMIRTSRYSTLMVTPEFRFYFKKKAPRGLYLAPFLRYKRESMKANFQYQESLSSSMMKEGEYRYSSNTFGVGAMLGLQVLCRNRVTLDFWFVGPWFGANYAKAGSKLNAAALDIYQKAYVETVTEQYSEFLGMSSAYKWTADGFNSSNNGTGIGIRMFGINLGYAF